MGSYYLNEAVIDLPERPFVDKTVHGLESKLPGDHTLGVFVLRSPVEAGRALRDLVDENVALNQRRLLGFTVLEESSAPVGGLPAIVLKTSWRNERKELYQLQAHVLVHGKLVTVAVSGPLDERATCDETFDVILQTLVWRVD